MSKKVEQPTGPAKEGRKDNVVKLEIRTPHGTASERRAHGKALRDSVPRESHAGWTPPHTTAAIRSTCQSNPTRVGCPSLSPSASAA